ncbi:hypothetical protein EMGBS15_09920 [Filimonas sp.]|nr:hypothetical protein EMGBS15_09920 [Filimonas sp.]
MLLFLLLTSFLSGSSKILRAGSFESEITNSIQDKAERYIRNVYEHINFGKAGRLSFSAFRYGFHGYLNLMDAGKIHPGSLLTICDFTLSSNSKRMWVIDVQNEKILFNTLVAHGMGTGEEYATAFSNTPESHQSSLGFYITGDTYQGGNGYSLQLQGVDGSFNSNAFERAIVIHGAPYVSESFACANKRLGRSHGCPALPPEIAPQVIDHIKNGSCLFIYAHSANYLTASYWLRNQIRSLPVEAERMEFLASAYGKENTEVRTTGDKETAAKHQEDLRQEEPVKISDFDKNNYRIEVQTIIIKKGTEVPKTAAKNVNSIVEVTKNRNTGISDTVIVR